VLFTTIFLFGLKEKVVFILALLFLLFTPYTPPVPNITKSNIETAFSIFANPDFFENYTLPDNYYYSRKDLADMSALITANKDQVMIFPYDNFILDIKARHSIPIRNSSMCTQIPMVNWEAKKQNWKLIRQNT